MSMSGMLDFWVIWQINVYLYKCKKVWKHSFPKFLYHFILLTEIYEFSTCFIFIISTLHYMFAFGLLKFKEWKKMNVG